MPKLKINDQEVEVPQGATILQACEQVGVEIPRFCYHERLKIAGNCRMCLVEMEKAPKPVASCAMTAAEGMNIHTNTPLVKKAREGVMEFLLANHPLDCPICDQGGECDLQDQAITYGKGKSRFSENKRAVKDKYFGPIIKTHMTRCIHCTRCVRFITDIAGTAEIGGFNRGEDTEIAPYLNTIVTSELSGNVIDLCPVGALTSRPYAFKARSWELSHAETIDIMDSVGSNIRMDYRGTEALRILPRINEDINEEWISDKTRFAYDGLKYQRIDQYYIKNNGVLEQTTQSKLYDKLKQLIKQTKPNEIAIIGGNLLDFETQFAAKNFAQKLNIPNENLAFCDDIVTNDELSNFLHFGEIKNIENADLCLIIGTNIRYDATMISARLRKSQLNNKLPIFTIGKNSTQIFAQHFLGSTLSAIENEEFKLKLKAANNPMIIIGEEILKRKDAIDIQKYFINFAKENNIKLNILLKEASRLGAIKLGLYHNTISNLLENATIGKYKLLINLAADEHNLSNCHKDCLKIYCGTHGDNGAHNADFIIPLASYAESSLSFLNCEARLQRTQQALPPLSNAMDGWQIFNILNDENLTLSELRKLISKEFYWFNQITKIIPHKHLEIDRIKEPKINWTENISIVDNYFSSNPILRASKIIANIIREYENYNNEVA